ncbi:mitochondrial inner membrane protease subunit 2-like isoform X1 [Chenopodium quinoa]|uniref:Peptidase S26 domain-containing protein n=1 Tax=Chenopodium quinoa TaxID=63459 RepID=A0A803LMQ4_CHEQI|nr:mitochondrial inner membrane protease subunit 2-like isoform X1 [Chenopodium quinoa]
MRQLWRLKLCWDYLGQKCDFAALITMQKRNAGQLLRGDVLNTYLKNAVAEKMTFFCQSKGSEMEPTISANETLFVRKLPYLNARVRGNPQNIHVGDVVVLKDPLNSNNYVVRRLAAVSGYEMVSNNKDDEPFVLKDGQCWVLSDNKNLKPEESNDSRTYGPISINNIVGRVIYRFQTAKVHNVVVNSAYSLQNDRSVLFVELDPAEVQLNNDKNSKDSQT